MNHSVDLAIILPCVCIAHLNATEKEKCPYLISLVIRNTLPDWPAGQIKKDFRLKYLYFSSQVVRNSHPRYQFLGELAKQKVLIIDGDIYDN